MPRLYAATGDAVARLDESGGGWTVELSLEGSGAQCIAVDPRDGRRSTRGLRGGGVRRTTDGGRTWEDCELPGRDVFSLAVSPADGAVYAGTEPSALFRSDDRGGSWRELDALLDLPSRPTWSFPPRPWTSHVRWIAPSPHDADAAPRRDRARRADALDRRRRELAGPAAGRAAGRALARMAPARRGPRVRGGRRRRRVERGRRRHVAPADDGRDRHYTWSVAVDPEDPDLWYVSASTGPFAAHGRGDPQAHSTAARTAAGGARGRPPRSAARDAVRARRDRGPSLRRARERRALGERRTRRRPGVRASCAARRSTASSRSPSAQPPSCRCSARCARPRRPRG